MPTATLADTFLDFVTHLPDFCALVDEHCQIVAANWRGCGKEVPASLREGQVSCATALLRHGVCPQENCYIRAALQSGSCIMGLEDHPCLGPIQIKAIPLSHNPSRKPLVALQISDVSSLKQTINELGVVRFALDSLIPPLAMGDLEGNLTYANQAFIQLWGYDSQEEILGKPAAHFWKNPLEAESMLTSLKAEGRWCGQLAGRKNNDTPFHVELSASVVNDHEGRPLCLVASFVDVTARLQAEQNLRASDARFREMCDSMPQTLFEADITGRITFANRHSLERFEYTPEDIEAGLNIFQVIYPSDRDQIFRAFQRILQGGTNISAEFTALTRSGRFFSAWLDANPIVANGAVTGIRGMLMDISSQKEIERSLRESERRYQHLAHHDTLTDLPNRTLLLDRLNHILRRNYQRQKPLAILFADLDRFKQINGSLGHNFGDQVLGEVALRLKNLLPEGDTLAKLSGDEFILICEDTACSDRLTQKARWLLDNIKTPLRLSGHTFHLSASIGIACSQNGSDDAETLLRQADIAMHEAKRQGGNHFRFFTQEMQLRREEAFLLEKRLRDALERQEFYLHYQPQVELYSGQMAGVEALVRWGDCPKERVSPEVFIKVAEDSGLIHPLGDYVLQEACAQNRRWQQQGLPPIRVTVNISAKQFGQPDFVDKIFRTLATTGLDPDWLELEITESAIMENVSEAIGIMRRLQKAGVRFAIDDFGTGYSSLNYLRQLPLTKLKIDRSFVADVPGNRDDEKLVASILALARSFDLQTVAEGIETGRQLDYLRQLDCGLGQGYLFCRPVAPETISQLIGNRLI